jgi:hypothetical protein
MGLFISKDGARVNIYQLSAFSGQLLAVRYSLLAFGFWLFAFS